MWSHQALYSGPLTDVDFDLVRQFVRDAEAANLFTESLTFEAKERKSGNNIAEAVAALSNTDGGIVLVGVKDEVAAGEDRIVGVSQRDHDQLVASLHNLLPAAMPQVWPVRIPGTDKIVIVLRVDADAVAHPVLVAGRVLYRVPGHTVPADRLRVLELVERDKAAAQGHTAASISVPASPWNAAGITVGRRDRSRPAGHRDR